MADRKRARYGPLAPPGDTLPGRRRGLEKHERATDRPAGIITGGPASCGVEYAACRFQCGRDPRDTLFYATKNADRLSR
jgi:hypothetical protein